MTTDLTSTPIERLAIEYAAERFARKEISPKSARLYRQCIGRFAAAVGPDRLLASIEPDEVEKWVARLARRNRPKASRDRIYILRAFYRWAVLQGAATEDATASIKAPWVAKSPRSRRYPRGASRAVKP